MCVSCGRLLNEKCGVKRRVKKIQYKMKCKCIMEKLFYSNSLETINYHYNGINVCTDEQKKI